MPKPRRVFCCATCGHEEPKWAGRCQGCGAWNTLIEGIQAQAPTAQDRARGTSGRGGNARPVLLNDVQADSCQRTSSQIPELDRVLGGGVVPGSLILVGGDPGIGKSTLLLQALAGMAAQKQRCLYFTAEESASQVKMRAERLDLASKDIFLLAETELEALEKAKNEIDPDIIVVDSVQTIGTRALESAVGSVAQIRAVTHHLMDAAKTSGTSIFIVGHVTKEGTLAGPKVMEHMVDTVLYFEGERNGPYRILRSHKNRFGSAREIGVFEMGQAGLEPVANPSELFLSQRAQGPGAVVISCLEGSRPILVEIQALTTSSLYSSPRRTVLGVDGQRVDMLCAVLDARGQVDLSGQDIYVNVAGGVRANEPAADLGVALALASSFRRIAFPKDTAAIGEVGLSGEVRGVQQPEGRAHEAAALGFSRCLVPEVDLRRWSNAKPPLELVPVASLAQALAWAEDA